MKYYGLPSRGARIVSLPPLSGGINYRDGEIIADNQLSDALNVWFKDGIIKTRPGFTTQEAFDVPINILQRAERIKTHSEIIKDSRTLVSFTVSSQRNNGQRQQTDYFFWAGDDGLEKFAKSTTLGDKRTKSDYIAFEHNNYIWLYYENGTIKKASKNDKANEFMPISPSEIYVPTVLHHCRAVTKDDYVGVQIEGHNLIGHAYKMIYSTVNREILTGGTTQVSMEYPLPKYERPAALGGKKFTAEITDKYGVTTTHEVTLNSSGWGEETEEKSDNLRMRAVIGAKGNISRVWFFTGEYQEVYLNETDWVEDNLVLTIPYEVTQEERGKVFKMTQSAWFGGAVAGKTGGTRLFLAGNTGDNDKALLIWSGLNNPLYFSENCYSYVGNREQPVTALGKQSDKLIIFKPDEMYYTYYAEGGEITADDLINQDVIDYDANAVLFPLVTLSSNMGCDVPASVKNCRGRLVWAHSDGHIYTLASLNSYNNALGVYPVSGMIEGDFTSDKSAIRNAIGADLDGYYALIIASTAYVCDYNSSGFRYISSYTKGSDANTKIPWYKWKLPDIGFFFSAGNILGGAALLHAGDSDKIAVSILSGKSEADADSIFVIDDLSAEIASVDIPSFLETKHFDFGIPSKTKCIDEINISFADNSGRNMLFEAYTEKGVSFSKSFNNIVTVPDKRAPGYTRNRIFRAAVPYANKIYLRISSCGAMGVSAVTINYRLLGGAK